MSCSEHMMPRCTINYVLFRSTVHPRTRDTIRAPKPGGRAAAGRRRRARAPRAGRGTRTYGHAPPRGRGPAPARGANQTRRNETPRRATLDSRGRRPNPRRRRARDVHGFVSRPVDRDAAGPLTRVTRQRDPVPNPTALSHDLPERRWAPGTYQAHIHTRTLPPHVHPPMNDITDRPSRACP